MKNKKILIAVVALVAVVAVLLGVYFATRPETQTGGKTITVTVVHKDNTEVVKTYQTEEEYLDKVLLAEGLISGEEGQYWLVVEYADGERANWELDNAYWSILVGDEAAVTGISQIPVYDGSTYQLVYTPMS